MRCTEPGDRTPSFPRLSACSNVPSATYVMPSMSRCGCIGHTAPGARRSSLNTRSVPKPAYSGSQYWSKLKCQFALNQPPSAWKSVRTGRSLIIGSPERERDHADDHGGRARQPSHRVALREETCAHESTDEDADLTCRRYVAHRAHGERREH